MTGLICAAVLLGTWSGACLIQKDQTKTLTLVGNTLLIAAVVCLALAFLLWVVGG